MNVFVDDCKTLEALPEYDVRPGKASKDLMIYQDFVNQKYTQDKKVSSMNWHPTIQGKCQRITKYWQKGPYGMNVLRHPQSDAERRFPEAAAFRKLLVVIAFGCQE